MSSPMYQVSVTFHDVAACFSAEEWGSLDGWQRELYKNVMREIHAALHAMGFEIINPDVLFRIKKVKDDYTNICDVGGTVPRAAFHAEDPEHLMGIKQERGLHPDLCRRKSTRAYQPSARNPDILLRIKQGDHPSVSEFSESSSTLSPGEEISGEPIVTSVFSLQMEKEKVEELHPAHRPQTCTTKSHKRFPSQPIKQEEVDYMKVSVGGANQERIAVSPRERFPSQPIKQEAVDYMKVSVGGAAQDNTAVTHQDTADAPPRGSDTGTASPAPEIDLHSIHGGRPPSSPSFGAHRMRKYTDKELEVLVDMVMENYSKLFGKESARTTATAKDAIWQAIADEINALGVDFRTTEKVRKRWLDAKRQMRKKVKEAAQHEAETGRRPPPYLRLAPYEQRLRDVFMPEFSKKVQWSRDEGDQLGEEESGLPESTSQDSKKTDPAPPWGQITEDESGNESSEEPPPWSPRGPVHISDHLDLGVGQDNGPNTDCLIEDQPGPSDGSVNGLIPETFAPCSPYSPQRLMEMQERHFSSINATLCRQSNTLHTISSHQRESNVLMQEQNAILSQIAYSLNLQIQQSEGLVTFGRVFHKGLEAMKPTPHVQPSVDGVSTTEPPNLQGVLRRQVAHFPRPNPVQTPIPPKRKIT